MPRYKSPDADHICRRQTIPSACPIVCSLTPQSGLRCSGSLRCLWTARGPVDMRDRDRVGRGGSREAAGARRLIPSRLVVPVSASTLAANTTVDVPALVASMDAYTSAPQCAHFLTGHRIAFRRATCGHAGVNRSHVTATERSRARWTGSSIKRCASSATVEFLCALLRTLTIGVPW